jgi:precorrin-2 dehydrogenase/sirohydrochlorin ferrochelatase
MAEKPEFPAVQGGGSLIIAWQIRDKKVLVVGGGEVRLSLFLTHLKTILTLDKLTLIT